MTSKQHQQTIRYEVGDRLVIQGKLCFVVDIAKDELGVCVHVQGLGDQTGMKIHPALHSYPIRNIDHGHREAMLETTNTQEIISRRLQEEQS